MFVSIIAFDKSKVYTLHRVCKHEFRSNFDRVSLLLTSINYNLDQFGMFWLRLISGCKNTCCKMIRTPIIRSQPHLRSNSKLNSPFAQPPAILFPQKNDFGMVLEVVYVVYVVCGLTSHSSFNYGTRNEALRSEEKKLNNPFISLSLRNSSEASIDTPILRRRKRSGCTFSSMVPSSCVWILATTHFTFQS